MILLIIQAASHHLGHLCEDDGESLAGRSGTLKALRQWLTDSAAASMDRIGRAGLSPVRRDFKEYKGPDLLSAGESLHRLQAVSGTSNNLERERVRP